MIEVNYVPHDFASPMTSSPMTLCCIRKMGDHLFHDRVPRSMIFRLLVKRRSRKELSEEKRNGNV